jgi:peroxiredoxin
MVLAPSARHARDGGVLVALVVALALVLAVVRPAAAAPMIGQPAPAFTGTDSNGNLVSLADLRGKVVVLEWTNHDCPFVRRHYDAASMQALQEGAKADGVVWLSIISSAPGEQGHVSAAEANRLTTKRSAHPAAVILDPDGTIGRLYDAKTTPHMYIIDATGVLVYMGAIDDQPRNLGADPLTARNYVSGALAQIKAGQPVDPAMTQPYGCSVKYRG